MLALLDDAGAGTDLGLDEALDLVAVVDDGLVHGFARVDDERATALAALAGAFAGSPLHARIAEAVDKIAVGSIADDHLLALAAARIAVFGAVHDALLARADAALNRARAPWQGAPGPAASAANLLAGGRSWLRELAITGWRGVDHDLVTASSQVIEAMLADPELRRLAVLAWHRGYAIATAEIRAFKQAGFSMGQYELVLASISRGRDARNQRVH